MPARRTTPRGYGHARRLRKTPTPEEAQLWERLRGNQLAGVPFRRQHAIGRYVVDFCSPRRRLVIELDGSPHQQAEDADRDRTMELEAQGYRVLRFWNREVTHNLDRVVQRIRDALRLA